MITATSFARTPNLPISFHAFQFGKVLFDDIAESDAARRRYQVRDWQPSDGGMPGWKWCADGWILASYPPRHIGEYFTIIRLADSSITIAPKRWWRCDPCGMPRDEDGWAHAAWRAIDAHYETQRGWWLQ